MSYFYKPQTVLSVKWKVLNFYENQQTEFWRYKVLGEINLWFSFSDSGVVPGVVILYLRGRYQWSARENCWALNQWFCLSHSLSLPSLMAIPNAILLMNAKSTLEQVWQTWKIISSISLYCKLYCILKYEMKYWCFLFCYQNYKWKFNYTINTVAWHHDHNYLW